MFSDLVLIVCGVVMLLAGLAVLHVAAPGELSWRALSALCIGASGAWALARALSDVPVQLQDLLLPVGVSVWLAGAMWGSRSRPMRRTSDWAGPECRRRPKDTP